MGRPVNNLTGKRVGRWLVQGRDMTVLSGFGHPTRWICVCECGQAKSVYYSNLNDGTSKSCGCLQRELLVSRNKKHGIYGTPLYWTIYGNMKRARKLQAMPKWADEEKMANIYKNRPLGCDVDHIVPLVSQIVCGLHCEDNLQYMVKNENQSKKNRYWPDMPESV